MTMLNDFNARISQSALQVKGLQPGMTVRVHQKITDESRSDKKSEKKKERVQIFEGIIIARHGRRPGQCTITVRKLSLGIGVERIFPLISPSIQKIEIVKRARVRRAKLYYLRSLRGKSLRMKDFVHSGNTAQTEASEKL